MNRLAVQYLGRLRVTRLALAFILILALAGLTLASPHGGRADAGPFPTKTRTVTPIPTAGRTVYPTILLPSAIPVTIFPTAASMQVQSTQPALQAESLQAEAESAQAAPAAAIACWPIAIILILAIIIGASYMLSRGKEG